jgi:hypothetical protein
MFNPALGDRGYGPLFIVYWDLAMDLMSYNVRDTHRVKQWTPEDRQFFFNPDFMRRQWYLDTAVKSQSEVTEPDKFFLRPVLEEDKFPGERSIQLLPEVAARVRAQEAAGRLVFEVEPTAPVPTVEVKTTAGPGTQQAKSLPVTAGEEAAGVYTQHASQDSPTTSR